MSAALARSAERVLTVGILCRADEPALGNTLASLRRAAASLEQAGWESRFIVCVNGPSLEGTSLPAWTAAASFAAELAAGRVRLIREGKADKARAWNLVRQACATAFIAFCDADVEVGEHALERLVTELERRPEVMLASARQVPILDHAGLVARAAALPSRFDLGVVGGPLYAMRAAAVEIMPEELLFEDAWLSARIGRASLTTVPLAEVRYRPPATLGDWYRQRLRTEAGKIQIREARRHEQPDGGPIARYPWREMLHGIHFTEWPLVALCLAVRFVARAVAEYSARRGRRIAWVTIPSTKPLPEARGELAR
jgi:cellulose synthase/poly-beta-1,6-N-acetylglucosamine synthase-like glycosyltransferase